MALLKRKPDAVARFRDRFPWVYLLEPFGGVNSHLRNMSEAECESTSMYPQSGPGKHGMFSVSGRVTNSFGLDLRILVLKLPVLCPFDINHTINNGMVDMNASWAKFSGQGLSQGPHGELASRKGGAASTALHCGRCGGEDQRRWVVGC